MFMCCVQASYATNYYFSSVSGDDTRTSTSAQNPSTPWKTIDKLNSISGSLQPGDSVLFKRGETFYGTMTIYSSGVSGKPVYYGAYGTGANPLITGFVTLSNWTLSSAGIYYASLDMPNLNIVTINGEAKGMGRYPNTGYLNYEDNNGNLSITDNELPAVPDWTGGEVVIRKLRYILDRHTVTLHSGTVINYSTSTTNGNNSAYSPVKGNGYFIQNHLQTLDQFGEWYYDNTAKRLYVFVGSNTPSNYVVKASTKDNNVTVSTLSYLKFENLDFEGGNARGISLVNVSNATVQNCNFYRQGGISLYGIDLSKVTVSGGSINTSFSNGIQFEYNANSCTIDGVSINNTNTIAGTGRSGDAVGIGIMVYGDSTTITNNKVVNTGYTGIEFIGNNVLVEHNYVDSFCTVKDDGGGIYTYTGPSNTTGVNRKVRNNIVLDAIGAYAGAEAYNYEPFGKAAGIYLDEYVNNVEVSGNSIAHGDWAGLMMHNAHDCQVSNNIIYDHRFQVHISQYAAATRNDNITGNQYVAKQASQNTFYYRTYVQDDPSTMGTLDRNYYARPIDDGATIRIDNFWTGGNGTSYISLAQWQAAYGQDPASQKSPLTYTANINDSLRFEYNASGTAKTVLLDAAYQDLAGNQYAGVLTVNPWTSVVLLKSKTISKLNQVITFPSIATKTYGDPPFALTATSSSALPVSYRVVSGPATITNNIVTLTGAGMVTIEASQAGNATYNAATPVQQSFTVAKASQTINFPAISNKSYNDPPFALNATASSGLTVSYTVVSGPAKISGNIVTLTGTGKVTIKASQAGNSNYNAATPVSQSFNVTKGGRNSAVTLQTNITASSFGSISSADEDQISITPNPVSNEGLVRVLTTGSATGLMGIYDMNGKLIKSLGQKNFEQGQIASFTINVQNLSAGIYFVCFATNGKIIKQMFQVVR